MEKSDLDLDELFAMARVTALKPSDDLMARVLADAEVAQPREPVLLHSRNQPAAMNWFDRIAAVFGGGGALAGMSFAAIAGIFLGIAQPAPVAALTSLLADASTESLDLFPGADAPWEE